MPRNKFRPNPFKASKVPLMRSVSREGMKLELYHYAWSNAWRFDFDRKHHFLEVQLGYIEFAFYW